MITDIFLVVLHQASLDKAKNWIRELQRQADSQIVIALAGNKADLEERRQVSTAVRNTDFNF